MLLTAEMSLYPFNEDYLPPIKGFISRLNKVVGLQVETHATCTILSGDDQLVMDTIRDGLRWADEQHGKVVLVAKFIPNLRLD